MELVRQPVFLLLFTVSPLVMIVLAAVPYFGFGGTDMGPVNFDIKMVKDGALSVMFISGLFAAVICASSSLAREVSTGTALAVLSKPVARMYFIIGKYNGICSRCKYCIDAIILPVSIPKYTGKRWGSFE